MGYGEPGASLGLSGACKWGSRRLQAGDLGASPKSRWGWIRLTVGLG